jgi:hypothetical protein
MIPIIFAAFWFSVTLHGQDPRAGELINETPTAKVNFDRKLPEFRFDKSELVDVFEFLEDITGVNISVDWNALEKAGINRNTLVTMRASDLSFRKAIQTIVDDLSGTDAKLRVDFGKDEITISAASDLKNPTTLPAR